MTEQEQRSGWNKLQTGFPLLRRTGKHGSRWIAQWLTYCEGFRCINLMTIGIHTYSKGIIDKVSALLIIFTIDFVQVDLHCLVQLDSKTVDSSRAIALIVFQIVLQINRLAHAKTGFAGRLGLSVLYMKYLSLQSNQGI